MGNRNSCCVYASPHADRKSKEIPPVFEERHNVYNHHHYQQQQQLHHQQIQQQHIHHHQQQQHNVHPHHHHHQQQQPQAHHQHLHGTIVGGGGAGAGLSGAHQMDSGHHMASTAAIHHHSAENFDNSQTLQHISEREALEGEEDPSVDPTAATMFLERSKIENGGITRKRSQHQIAQQNSISGGLKKSSSCSTIYLDDSTVSQPNLKNTVKCVSLAIYYHIKNRQSDRRLDIFDEKLHPLTNDLVPDEYDIHNPEHRQIYKFVRTLFNAAQLTAECAIITLVYLERLLTYAELDVAPSNWKRMVLGKLLTII